MRPSQYTWDAEMCLNTRQHVTPDWTSMFLRISLLVVKMSTSLTAQYNRALNHSALMRRKQNWKTAAKDCGTPCRRRSARCGPCKAFSVHHSRAGLTG